MQGPPSQETEQKSSTTPSESAEPRGKPSSHGRFIWLAHQAIERIVNELGQTQAAFGIAVYVALCRLSSKEKNAASIQATVQKIAGMARLSYPKTLYILDALDRQAKVISTEHSRKRSTSGRVTQSANTYTILRLNPVKSEKGSFRVNGVNPESTVSDLTGVAHSGSDNPIDPYYVGKKRKKRSATTGGSDTLLTEGSALVAASSERKPDFE